MTIFQRTNYKKIHVQGDKGRKSLKNGQNRPKMAKKLELCKQKVRIRVGICEYFMYKDRTVRFGCANSDYSHANYQEMTQNRQMAENSKKSI